MVGDCSAANAFESADIDLSFMARPVMVMMLVAVLCSLFLAVTFIQSSLNKLSDYKGNKLYFASVFEKTFLKNAAGILLPVITAMEFLSGFGLLAGIVCTFCCRDTRLLIGGLVLGALSFICLLAGQRIAKDYAGAASLTTYFLIAVVGLVACAFIF